MPKMKFTIITLFPEALKPYLDSSMIFKAQERGIIEIDYVNLRDFGLGAHRSVDDTPYGGGDGMLLRPEPAFAAIETVKANDSSAEVILPTPGGLIWDQALVRQFAGVDVELIRSKDYEKEQDNNADEKADACKKRMGDARARHLIIFCPHYEGYDERILSIVDYPISLGNYVLTGGELPALIIIDSITRLLPGVLGGETSALVESFSDGNNLEFPQYTKPAEFRGMAVPEVLLSGHHGKIAEWRAEQSRLRTEKAPRKWSADS